MFREYRQWIPYIKDVFMPICDTELGDFRSFPFPGSIMEQPYITMQILYVIQAAFKKVMSERQKAALQKSKTSH